MNRPGHRHPIFLAALLLAVAVWCLAGACAQAKALSIGAGAGQKNALWGFEMAASGILLPEHAGSPDFAREAGHYGYETAMGLAVWPSRDPIGERGGLNLYGMAGNDPVNHWDYLGLADQNICFAKPKTMKFTGSGWKHTSVSTDDSGGSQWFVTFDFTATVTYEAEVTVECFCACYKGGGGGIPEMSTKTASGTRTITTSFEVNSTRLDPTKGGPFIPLPSGATLANQLAAALAPEAGGSISATPLPSGLLELMNGVVTHTPTKPQEGNWKGGDPCAK